MYIINSKTILSLIDDFRRFHRQEIERAEIFSNREDWERLYEKHDYKKVESIIKKYFEIL